VTLPYSVGIGVPKGKTDFRDAIMAALLAIQKSGAQTELLNKWQLGAQNLEPAKLIVSK
jgi:polar amino acid transport system substrate-binding protein